MSERTLTLTKCEMLGNWYVLEGGRNWASVEGTAEEWRAIAGALRRGETCRHRRCAAEPKGPIWRFWSPRNAYQPSDIVEVPRGEGEVLADHIGRVLAAYDAPSAEATS